MFKRKSRLCHLVLLVCLPACSSSTSPIPEKQGLNEKEAILGSWQDPKRTDSGWHDIYFGENGEGGDSGKLRSRYGTYRWLDDGEIEFDTVHETHGFHGGSTTHGKAVFRVRVDLVTKEKLKLTFIEEGKPPYQKEFRRPEPPRPGIPGVKD